VVVQNRLDAIDVDKAVDFVLKCQNFDGGFGSRPGSESHAGQVVCYILCRSSSVADSQVVLYSGCKLKSSPLKVYCLDTNQSC